MAYAHALTWSDLFLEGVHAAIPSANSQETIEQRSNGSRLRFALLALCSCRMLLPG